MGVLRLVSSNYLFLRWSAIQTLLERSISDALILLDCCAGAASATFPNGKSITETISASSWNAIAPDPGRFSFTSTLIEVLQEWKARTFSAAMLHAEILARLKHPRPILIDNKHSEARTTPVHFMMTSNHKAPSIEFSRVMPQNAAPPSPIVDLPTPQTEEPPPAAAQQASGRFVDSEEVSGPTIDEPHVMISLALEDDQRLDLNAWEQWLANFPAFARHVKVQGVFQSHSTLLLLSLPVMVWDLLPEDPACSFVAFIRSDNLVKQQSQPPEPVVVDAVAANDEGVTNDEDVSSEDSETESVPGSDDELEEENGEDDRASILTELTGTTYFPNEDASMIGRDRIFTPGRRNSRSTINSLISPHDDSISQSSAFVRSAAKRQLEISSTTGRPLPPRLQPISSRPINTIIPSRSRVVTSATGGDAVSRDLERRGSSGVSSPPIPSQMRRGSRRDGHGDGEYTPGSPVHRDHVERCLDEYFQQEPHPDSTVTQFLASSLGLEKADVEVGFVALIWLIITHPPS